VLGRGPEVEMEGFGKPAAEEQTWVSQSQCVRLSGGLLGTYLAANQQSERGQAEDRSSTRFSSAQIYSTRSQWRSEMRPLVSLT
jgi:hypothetical protein